MLKFVFTLFFSAFVGLLFSSCTSFPVYERTIVRIYDADMNLKEIQEIEHISQPDPIDRTLHPELAKQTYALPHK